MDWILEDWEYTNDEIYFIERQRDYEILCQKWEEDSKNRKPAIIKVIKPKNENKHKPSEIRRINQEGV